MKKELSRVLAVIMAVAMLVSVGYYPDGMNSVKAEEESTSLDYTNDSSVNMNYYYTDLGEGEGPGWYIGIPGIEISDKTKLDVNSILLGNSNSTFYVDAVGDELYSVLKNLKRATLVSILFGYGNIVIGNSDDRADIGRVQASCSALNLTINGDVSDLLSENGTVTLNGNVTGTLELGSYYVGDQYDESMADQMTGLWNQNTVINGNVNKLIWYQNENNIKASYKGDLTVTGTVTEGTIKNIITNTAVSSVPYYDGVSTFKNATGQILDDGVLNSGIVTTAVEAEEDNSSFVITAEDTYYAEDGMDDSISTDNTVLIMVKVSGLDSSDYDSCKFYVDGNVATFTDYKSLESGEAYYSTYSLTDLAVGSHTIYAEAYKNDSLVATTPEAAFTVTDGLCRVDSTEHWYYRYDMKMAFAGYYFYSGKTVKSLKIINEDGRTLYTYDSNDDGMFICNNESYYYDKVGVSCDNTIIYQYYAYQNSYPYGKFCEDCGPVTLAVTYTDGTTGYISDFAQFTDKTVVSSIGLPGGYNSYCDYLYLTIGVQGKVDINDLVFSVSDYGTGTTLPVSVVNAQYDDSSIIVKLKKDNWTDEQKNSSVKISVAANEESNIYIDCDDVIFDLDNPFYYCEYNQVKGTLTVGVSGAANMTLPITLAIYDDEAEEEKNIASGTAVFDENGIADVVVYSDGQELDYTTVADNMLYFAVTYNGKKYTNNIWLSKYTVTNTVVSGFEEIPNSDEISDYSEKITIPIVNVTETAFNVEACMAVNAGADVNASDYDIAVVKYDDGWDSTAIETTVSDLRVEAIDGTEDFVSLDFTIDSTGWETGRYALTITDAEEHSLTENFIVSDTDSFNIRSALIFYNTVNSVLDLYLYTYCFTSDDYYTVSLYDLNGKKVKDYTVKPAELNMAYDYMIFELTGISADELLLNYKLAVSHGNDAGVFDENCSDSISVRTYSTSFTTNERSRYIGIYRRGLSEKITIDISLPYDTVPIYEVELAPDEDCNVYFPREIKRYIDADQAYDVVVSYPDGSSEKMSGIYLDVNTYSPSETYYENIYEIIDGDDYGYENTVSFADGWNNAEETKDEDVTYYINFSKAYDEQSRPTLEKFLKTYSDIEAQFKVLDIDVEEGKSIYPNILVINVVTPDLDDDGKQKYDDEGNKLYKYDAVCIEYEQDTTALAEGNYTFTGSLNNVDEDTLTRLKDWQVTDVCMEFRSADSDASFTVRNTSWNPVCFSENDTFELFSSENGNLPQKVVFNDWTDDKDSSTYYVMNPGKYYSSDDEITLGDFAKKYNKVSVNMQIPGLADNTAYISQLVITYKKDLNDLDEASKELSVYLDMTKYPLSETGNSYVFSLEELEFDSHYSRYYVDAVVIYVESLSNTSMTFYDADDEKVEFTGTECFNITNIEQSILEADYYTSDDKYYSAFGYSYDKADRPVLSDSENLNGFAEMYGSVGVNVTISGLAADADVIPNNIIIELVKENSELTDEDDEIREIEVSVGNIPLKNGDNSYNADIPDYYISDISEWKVSGVRFNFISDSKEEFAVVTTGTGITLVCINKTEFPDDYFRNYVSAHFDTDKNGVLDDTEVAAVKSIEFTETGKVYSLEGIQYFKNLEYLYAFCQCLTELDLSENTELTTINIQCNNLSKIDLSKNTKLCNYNEAYKDTASNGYTGINNQSICRSSIEGSIEDDKYTAIVISFPLHNVYDLSGDGSLYSDSNPRYIFINAPTASGSLLDDSAVIETEVWGSLSLTDGNYCYHGRCFDEQDVYFPNIWVSKDTKYEYFYAYVMYVVKGEYTEGEAEELVLDSFGDEFYFETAVSQWTVYEDVMKDCTIDEDSKISMQSMRDSILIDSAVFQYYDVDFRQFVGSDGDRIKGYYEENTQGDVDFNGESARFLPVSTYSNATQGVRISSGLKTQYYYSFNNDTIYGTKSEDFGSYCLGVDLFYNYVVDTRKMETLPDEIADIYDAELEDVEDLEDYIAAESSTDEYNCESICTYDADLWEYAVGGWTTVSDSDFPADGVEVFIPYDDENIKKGTDIVIAHVFTHDINGYKAGDIEYPEITYEDAGIRFTVHGFSPIVVMNKVEIDNTIVKGVNASLADNVKMNFYLNSAALENVDKIAVAGPSGEIYLTKSEISEDNNGNLYVTYEAAPKDFDQTITVSGVNGDGEAINSYSITVNEYLNEIATNGDGDEDTDDTKLTALAQALIQYGETAEKYFEDSDQIITGVDKANISSDYKPVVPDALPGNVTFLGASLMVESTTCIRFYFNGDMDGCTVLHDGKSVVPEKISDGLYCITSDKINATGLDDAYVLTFSDGSSGAEITYSALGYCYYAQNADGALMSLADAIYWYWNAAEEYSAAVQGQ